jgi:hypothetical protein
MRADLAQAPGWAPVTSEFPGRARTRANQEDHRGQEPEFNKRGTRWWLRAWLPLAVERTARRVGTHYRRAQDWRSRQDSNLRPSV